MHHATDPRFGFGPGSSDSTGISHLANALILNNTSGSTHHHSRIMIMRAAGIAKDMHGDKHEIRLCN